MRAFEACKIKGLTGEQGVIIPAQNRQHLMLRDEIITAVQQGQFHIYSIATVDEGLELLSGCRPVHCGKTGPLPPGSFQREGLAQLQAFNEILRGEKDERGAGEK